MAWARRAAWARLRRQPGSMRVCACLSSCWSRRSPRCAGRPAVMLSHAPGRGRGALLTGPEGESSPRSLPGGQSLWTDHSRGWNVRSSVRAAHGRPSDPPRVAAKAAGFLIPSPAAVLAKCPSSPGASAGVLLLIGRFVGTEAVSPGCGCCEVGGRADGDVGETMPLLQGPGLLGPKVASTAVQRPVTPVLVHRGTAPLGVRGERVVGVDARESARRLVRRSGTAVLAHTLDDLRPRWWSAERRRDLSPSYAPRRRRLSRTGGLRRAGC